MGVQNLWKTLSKGGAVEVLEGQQPGHHARIVEAVANKVVAVDLSAWLMQAQTQPALREHYDSDYARAVKVVFDRTIHWLRYGCLPVFVIEGRTPAAKLDKLRARCVAQYGPSSYASDVGNRAGGQFDRLGQAVKRLLNAFGVPCVQAEGEGEAMCAALNVCGWAHAVHTADVDALLFGALTVYRQMHLQTDDPRKSSLTRCCMYDVRRVLGISRGGDAALTAVAQLAGGDYDMGGADNVGDTLALAAVRQLLAGCEDDELVLQRLEAAIAAGPDPELDALTKCTGCRVCGHEGGRKSKINAHSARNGCAACGCEDGCKPREWTECECAFHAKADERLLNRVVRRAAATPNFMSSFKTAANTYAEQTRLAISSVQREYGLPAPGSSRNVFSWQARPDVRAISDIMCRYIPEWDYKQVRLKLLPLLLEWDVRQGPSPSPLVRPLVQFRPSTIRKVSSRGADPAELSGVPIKQQQGWRYVLVVDRLPGGSNPAAAGAAAAAAAAAGSAGDGAEAAAAAAATEQDDAEDLAIDQAWMAGTARSRAPKQGPAAASGGAVSGGASQRLQGFGDSVDLLGDDSYEGEAFLATQMPSGTQSGLGSPLTTRGFSSSQQQPSQGGSGAASGGGPGSLQFAEHRSVRCNLIDTVWPHLTAAFRQPAASGGRARSGGGGSKKKAAVVQVIGAAADEKQRTVKDFFGVVKDYIAPGRQPAKLSAAEGGSIPGLAGLAPLASHGSDAGLHPDHAEAAGQPSSGAAAAAPAGAGSASAAAGAANGAAVARQQPQQSFMEWLGQEHDAPQQQHSSHTQAAEPPKQQQQQQGRTGQKVRAGTQSTQTAAAAGGGTGSSRGRKKQAAVKTPVRAGPLDRFLRPAAAVAATAAVGSTQPVQQEEELLRQSDDGEQPRGVPLCSDPEDCGSPEIPSLAARLAARATAAGAAAAGSRAGLEAAYRASPRSRQRSASPQHTAAAAVEGAAWQVPPAKKASTDLAKVLLNSPVSRGSPAAAGASPAAEHDAADVGAGPGPSSAVYYSQYQTLLEQMGVASPDQQHPQQRPRQGSKAVKGLFTSQQQRSAADSQLARPAQLQMQEQPECIELLDSPMPMAPVAGTGAGAKKKTAGIEVVDLT